MLTIDKILPVTQVKKELLTLIKTLQKNGGSYAITKDGKAAGILMSLDEYEGLMETVEILNDQALVRSLKKAVREAQKGEMHSEKEVFKD
ncbi:MAG TPA: type II toxin-antitoxin system prevent-host-death family antitoxin [Deltaproteobacteria bacterium]|nr:MAG: hypothetical protein A2048_10875 [Deltaproteobacteria bacterium GWA2_45_12]HBF12661.1 type II toxin-antitoxin system prevent-host-death family antitoxin [Deltaproteobacteria bacterium]